MIYDIVSNLLPYKGIERSLSHEDFLTTHAARKDYKRLLNIYFEYISLLTCNVSISKSNFEEVVVFYHRLLRNNIQCEVIAYSETPLKEVFGYEIRFLGIDIVQDMSESLISEDSVSKEVQKLLNTNGLCDNLDDVSPIISMCEHGGLDWKPCWVYKVKC